MYANSTMPTDCKFVSNQTRQILGQIAALCVLGALTDDLANRGMPSSIRIALLTWDDTST